MPRGVYKHKKGVYRHSEKTRRKISESNKGKVGTWTGKKRSTEARQKMSKNHNPNSNKSGKDAPNWKGGITKLDVLCRKTKEYKQWRSDVFQRDDWTCQTSGERGCYLEAHHIKSFSLILKENNITSVDEARKCKELWDISNGVTLCLDCHSLTHNYKGRSKGRKITK